MTNYISSHAKMQAQLRYGKQFPDDFIDFVLQNGIRQTVINRKGHLVKNKNRGIYRCVYEGQIVECVISKHRNGDIVLVTFNTPPDSIDEVCYSYRVNAER